ncbi:MAG TPA: oxidoreductase [Anaeromyxobacteraceae bacterium]|nr:oxidoreductase [Anaeromyxobacteraceae bacterium]
MTLAAAPLAPARVLEAWDETPMLRAIRLELAPPFADAHRRPGQVVKLHAGSGEAYFALASAPRANGQVELLVKRGGKVADAAVADAVPGATLSVSAPFGKGFAFEEAQGRHVLLFAAGSGIAPIRSLVEHILRRREDYSRVTLFYGQRLGRDFAYQREHLAWERGGVRVVLCPSREDEAWPGVRGRVQVVAHSLGFGGSPPEVTVAFVCGMTAMVDDVKATLARAGIPSERVHLNF